ncbi:AAA family ATPase [Deinococcus maricopensis]|uniref:Metal dependent phosphohydrolase n=1 Tax=Deinococcus maricopensis (strain DSM 21211 / LMG 22137 / NRRL B-23946 / LB-34) TaxID=709986 RepID=E8U4B7_DEIML|nr:AAA family ATPase [Deinococcus maricopensis]ADV65954.1 metal dependent phosphohydrolase [Deinococcus maricopensis DSM 21211]
MNAFLNGLRAGDQPDLAAFTRELGAALPLLAELPRTPQDPEWHGEGDVGTHTDLVLQETYHLADTHALSGDARLTLVLAAALHDLGKPLVTRRDDSRGTPRIVSPRHADRGRSYLAYRLPELDLPHAVTRDVMALVGHHHDLARTLTDGSLRAYRRLARQVDLQALYLLEVADTRGRVSADRDSKLEDLELFRLGAQEYGVWDATDPYAEWRADIQAQLRGFPDAYVDLTLESGILDHEAGLISTPHEAVARAYAARAGFPDLTVTVGPSGAGKSAWVAAHYPDHAVVSLDALRDELAGRRADQSVNGRVLQAAKEQLRVALRARRPVVWDATNTRRDFRGVPLRLGFEYGALTTLAVFQPPLSTVFERNPARTHAVPAHVVAAQVDLLEFPYRPEAHRTRVIGEYGETLDHSGFSRPPRP